MDGFPLFFATSGPTKRRKHYLCLLFSQYGVCYFLNISRNPNLRTSPKNQFRDYHAWNRIEKLMPLNWNFAPRTLKTSNKTGQSVFKLDFLVKSGFPKTRDLSPAAPRGYYILTALGREIPYGPIQPPEEWAQVSKELDSKELETNKSKKLTKK